MPETKLLKKGITRRSFLKTSAAVGGVAALSGTAFGCSSISQNAFAEQNTEETFFHTVCRGNCAGQCSMKVFVREGKAVRTEISDWDQPEYKRICARGLSRPLRQYDPTRIKYPMKRAGERGDDQWERITWDEAIAEIANNFQEIQEKYGKQAIYLPSGGGNSSVYNGTGMRTKFQNIIGATGRVNTYDEANTNSIARVLGTEATTYVANEQTDIVNAKNIILWAENISEAHPQQWHFLADALDAGARLIVIDPVYTIAASKADLYVPIRPGTDPYLIMAMMGIIIEENLIDIDFLKSKTVAPFLARKDNGKFIRMSDLGVAPTEGPIDATTKLPTVIDPPVVIDESTAQPGSSVQIQNPTITGNFTVAGYEARTAWDLLVDEIKKTPAQIASEKCGISIETIAELAHIAADTPVYHYLGFGSQAYGNGVSACHALATLGAIVGNLGYSGASVGGQRPPLYAGHSSAWQTPAGVTPGKNFTDFAIREIASTGKYNGTDFPIKAVFHISANPLSNAMNTKEYQEKVLDNAEFIVVADVFLNDTARYADIVLPASDWYETGEDVVASQPSTHSLLSEDPMQPLFESKPDEEILRTIAEKMGLGDYFTQSRDEILHSIVDTSVGAAVGITLDALREKKVMRNRSAKTYIAYEGGVFKTPTGRVEFYLESPKPRVQENLTFDPEKNRLPMAVDPFEASQDNELFEKYPLVTISKRGKFRVHTQFSALPMFREIDPEPILRINPADAEQRGISDGDYVEVYNDRGHAVAKAVLSQGIMPGVVMYPKGWQKSQFKAGSWGELTSSQIDPAASNSNFMDVLTEVRIWKGDDQ
ncbi:dehydrogenase [Actinomycetota bacterium]|nr:dehydrogenase [Actinomycetota bacterium]